MNVKDNGSGPEATRVRRRGEPLACHAAIGKRPAGLDERLDAARAQLVDMGVAIAATGGRRAAESFMRKSRVPQHVALRVLSCAAFRRKPAV